MRKSKLLLQKTETSYIQYVNGLHSRKTKEKYIEFLNALLTYADIGCDENQLYRKSVRVISQPGITVNSDHILHEKVGKLDRS
jgi:hypothetical protein